MSATTTCTDRNFLFIFLLYACAVMKREFFIWIFKEFLKLLFYHSFIFLSSSEFQCLPYFNINPLITKTKKSYFSVGSGTPWPSGLSRHICYTGPQAWVLQACWVLHCVLHGHCVLHALRGRDLNCWNQGLLECQSKMSHTKLYTICSTCIYNVAPITSLVLIRTLPCPVTILSTFEASRFSWGNITYVWTVTLSTNLTMGHLNNQYLVFFPN